MRLAVPLLLAASLAAPAAARVVSYAPVTNRYATPIHQPRASDRFVLAESDVPSTWYYSSTPRGRLVIHDATGREEPRVVLPTTGPEVLFSVAGARPGSDGILRILALVDRSPQGVEDYSKKQLLFSRDGGETWVDVLLPSGVLPVVAVATSPVADFGGPNARGRQPSLRLGSDATPFFLCLQKSAYGDDRAVVAVDDDGAARLLTEASMVTWPDGQGSQRGYVPSFVGTSHDGSSVLMVGGLPAPGTPGQKAAGLWRVDASGGVERLVELVGALPSIEAWLTPGGLAYLDVDLWAGPAPAAPFHEGQGLYLVESGTVRRVAGPEGASPGSGQTGPELIAIPTSDFEGAWISRRGLGRPTTLARHTPGGGLVEMWSDPTAPEVEALHAGASGQRLLVQVHRPRPQMDQRLILDPALAVWEVGEPAPARYDELFLNEQPTKGFVHLDVETVASGQPFVFDAGPLEGWCCVGGGPSGDGGSGGADVFQEWGVVKGSLRQRLVIPAVARTGGEGGAFWKTDLLLRNPADEPVQVDLQFVPASVAGPVDPVPSVFVVLGPREIRLFPDVLESLIHVEAGSGALFLTPEGTRVVSATTRTYTASEEGSYGMSLGAVDLFAASSARFPLAFSGAFPGWGYRTNAGAVDVAGRGATVGLRFASESGWAGRFDLFVEARPDGTAQLNRLGTWLGVEPWRAGALKYAPTRGESIPFVTSIDETTNDPTAWRPDLPAPVARAIPALVHADGRNGARFRSDLFLYNDSDAPASVTLAAKRWSSTAPEKLVTLTLFPREAKAVRDALAAVFQLDGVARLRFLSGEGGAGLGVRVTSRAYTVRPDGGTYGVPLPPLNAFQMAGAGEALELFGVLGGPSFRTNLALVDMTAFANGSTVRARVEVIGDGGAVLDAFDVNVPVAGGIQVDDVFRSRGLGDGPPAALIRVSPAGGLVGAYATSIDQGTNDAILVSAALAARD
ncbi:MAG: hypothetical protein ACYC4P_02380 [Thermoanaerobaculia bacterium]